MGHIGIRQAQEWQRNMYSFFLAMVLLMLVNPGNCGLTILANSSFVFVSDGVREFQQPDFIVLDHWPSSDHSSYSQRIVSGDIFLILVYISLMLFAAKLMYDGSEILVEVASPRITGGVFLPLLGSVLDAIISFGKIDFEPRYQLSSYNFSKIYGSKSESWNVLLLAIYSVQSMWEHRNCTK